MRSILSIFLFLCASLLAFSQSNTYQVGFLLDRNSTEINGLLEELSNEISAVVGEDALPSIELLQLLGEWQPDNDQWLEQLQGLDNVIAASEGELVESTAPAAGSPEAEPTSAPAELNEPQEQDQ